MTKVQYGYLNTSSSELHYWEMFDTLKDAVSACSAHTDIYEFTPKLLGKFKIETKVVKQPSRKK